NPVTLSVLTATVATLSPDWTASPPPQPLVLLEPAQGIARTVTTGSQADRWPVDTVDVRPLWVGRAGGTLAWITSAGQTMARLATVQGVTMGEELPAGRQVVDVRLLDEERLAVLSTPADSSQVADSSLVFVTVYNLPAHLVAFEVGMSLPDLSPAQVPPFAWDVDANRLYLGEGFDGRLHAVDLQAGTVATTDLPSPAHRRQEPPQSTELSLSAAGGRVAVSGVDHIRLQGGRGDTFPQALGIVLLDADLNVLAHRDDASTTRAFPIPGSDRVYAFPDGPGALLLDGQLSPLDRLLLGQNLVDFIPGVTQSYAITCSDVICDPSVPPAEGRSATAGARPSGMGRRLLSIQSETGQVTGLRSRFSADQTFLPQQALLVSPEPPVML
ncbi:MAG: hypothetical protein ACR2HR_07030, partial [Euzebya sp.]